MQNLKRIILSLMIVTSFASFSEAQVGINITSPKATLDVVGAADDSQKTDGLIAPRLTGDQLKAKDAQYTPSQDGTIIYVTIPLASGNTSARTVNILEKGYYSFDSSRGSNGEWVRLFHRYPQTLAGGTTGSANTGGAVTISSSNASNGTATLISKTFTLERPGLVSFTFSIPITNVALANGTSLSGGNSKLMAANMFISGGNLNNYLVVRDGISIANSNGAAYTNSGYQVNGTRTISLQAGTYTVNLNPLVFAQDSAGIRATFGDNNYADTVLDIISLPTP
ncbi:hypothetical protein EGI16_07285 [Chryseobacterium sp. G0240]|uniref:hypothetical protein n=1 Tax=Chryseobacterium sp. G0240 TaxID=2487066 RepID=UPI000F44B4C1|nr:hypothetical protein [Chryseobacterium sp. G0240]ROI05115.1 hypothetical protein EGI16_07285 [Chryseobacterium sp. G0240]